MDSPFLILGFCWGVPLLLAFGLGVMVGRGYQFIIRFVKPDEGEYEDENE